MRVLAISSAGGGAAIAIVQDGQAIASSQLLEEHGLAAALPRLVQRLLAEQASPIGSVAAVIGPGSFTGVRAGLAVAHGVAIGWGLPIIGVSVAEALADEAGRTGAPDLDGREMWTALHARRGRVFLHRGGSWGGYATDALPGSPARVAVCGSAAELVAGELAARGIDVLLTAYRRAQPVHVALVASARLAERAALLPALPLYVDEAEAKLPNTGLRPPPRAPGAG